MRGQVPSAISETPSFLEKNLKNFPFPRTPESSYLPSALSCPHLITVQPQCSPKMPRTYAAPGFCTSHAFCPLPLPLLFSLLGSSLSLHSAITSFKWPSHRNLFEIARQLTDHSLHAYSALFPYSIFPYHIFPPSVTFPAYLLAVCPMRV